MGRNSSTPVRSRVRSTQSSQLAYSTGDTVPVTGIFGVTHAGHRLPHEVLILKDERFPRCAKCSDSVVFTLIRAVEASPQGFGYRLFELPVIDSEPIKIL